MALNTEIPHPLLQFCTPNICWLYTILIVMTSPSEYVWSRDGLVSPLKNRVPELVGKEEMAINPVLRHY